MIKARKQTLPNGVRIITIPLVDNPAVTVMVFAAAGSNNERAEHKGVAHFLEHMCMKGGTKYDTPHKVSATLDALGAESNAATGHEYTVYYAKGNPKHFSRMFDVVSDVYLNARLDKDELEKERGVVIEEINMYQDTPKAYVQDLFYQALYGDQPAGWHTLGTKETVASMPREAFEEFKNTYYTASNTVVVVAGEIDQRRVRREIHERFGDMPRRRIKRRQKPRVRQAKPHLLVSKRTTDQTHFVVGVHALRASDKRMPSLMVLNAVLGGGMSSRLFQKLREEMGVCYYVRSSVQTHDMHGNLAISAGVDTKRVLEVTRVITNELRRLCDEQVYEKELKKAREYLIGHMFLDLETSEGIADFYVEQELLTGEMKTPSQWAQAIRNVTARDIQRLARLIFKNDLLNMAVVGKVKDEKALRRTLNI